MKAEIYTKPNCPFCVKAKYLLNKHGIEFDEVSAVDNRDALIERVILATGAAPRTVPQIFLDGQHVGGHDQLVVFFETVLVSERTILVESAENHAK